MGRVSVHSFAKADLEEIELYICTGSLAAALRFHDAAQKAFSLLAHMPGMGTQRPTKSPALQGLRTWPIKGFRRYLVCYRPIADGIEVLRVLNGVRNLNRLLDLLD